jgi:hypothetical protein
MIAGLLGFVPVTMFVVNPLLAVFLVWTLRIPDRGPVVDAGAQFWIAAGIPVVISAIGLLLFARAADEYAPKPRKRGRPQDLPPGMLHGLLTFLFPMTWAMSFIGGRTTDVTASGLSAHLDISIFAAEFIQATVQPAVFVFLVSLLSVYAIVFGGSKVSRRLRGAIIVACYVVMAVVFVFVGRSSGAGYW